MRRREFIFLLSATGATWPLLARAQQVDARAAALLSRILQLEANGAHSDCGLQRDRSAASVGIRALPPGIAAGVGMGVISGQKPIERLRTGDLTLANNR